MYQVIARRYFNHLKASNLSNIQVLRDKARGSAEANQTGSLITVYDNFFEHSTDIQRHILAHELGHWHREHFIPLRDIMGFEEGEGFYNVYGLPYSEEGYAEAFAVYLIRPSELKKRYPTAMAFLKDEVGNPSSYVNWVGKALTELKNMPYGVRQKIKT